MTKKPVKMEEWNPEDDKKPQKAKAKIPEEKKKPDMATINDVYDVISGLPTDGRLYPDGTVIKARALKVLEVKILAGITEETANDIVNDILERTVQGIDINDIYSADKLYIMFWLRANTYKESGYNVKFECPKCKTDSEFAFELDQLNIKIITDDALKFLNGSFELPNNDKLTFKLLTVGDEKQNEQFLKDNKSSLMNFDEEIIAICRMISTINGEKKGMIDKYMYITEQLSPVDYSYLESYLEDKGAGLEPTINVKCQKCGVTSDTMLPFRPDFFLPKIRS
jgi:hypothetical protein